MRITAIRPQKNHPERVNIEVDGEFRFALAQSLVWDEALHEGDLVTPEGIAELECRDASWKAREAALNLLSFRARSAAELRRRLLEKAYDPGLVDECVAALVERGLVNDVDFAGQWARGRVRSRPRGERSVVQELRIKGVDADLARAAFDEALQRENTSETELAIRAAAKWRPKSGEERVKARARLHAFLARRGFGAEAIRAAMQAVLG